MSFRLDRRHVVRPARAAVAAAIASGALLVVGATMASAHVGTDQDEVSAGASTTLTFGIGHGCEESPTTSMKFQIPAGVLNAAPVVKAGWSVDVEREALDEAVESAHGEAQTDRTAVITFTAQDGYAVPNGYRDSFALYFTAPEDEGALFFKIIQGCESGENAWIDEWDGTGDEPEHPAPSVMVVAASAGEGDGHGSTADTGSDDDSSNGLAIAALIVGALGLLAGGTALVRSRRPSARPE
jgi:periplasmic copper chaperone A